MALGAVRTRLLLLLAAILAFVLVAATFRAYERRTADIRHTLATLQDRAQLISEQQRDVVRRTARFVSFARQNLDVVALASGADCPSRLQTYVENDDYLANLLITDVRGHIICNPSRIPVPPDVNDREYFQAAMAGPAPVIGDPVFGRITRRWVVPFAQRYENARGQAAGVIVAALDLNWIDKAFNRLAASEDIQLGLVTSKGIVLAREPEPAAWVGKDISGFPVFRKMLAADGEGAIEAVNHRNEARIYSFSKFAVTSHDTIYFWMSVPREAATAKADEQFRSALLLVGLLLAVTFVLAWLGGYRLIVYPIERIVHAARRLSKGDFTARTGLPHASGEMGQLAMAFDEMAAQLASIDPITGLLNLQSFEAALASALETARGSGQAMMVLRMQIKDFGHIEGSHGPALGNDVIKRVGQHLHESMTQPSLIAHLGDSNFAIARPVEHDMLSATQLVEQLESGLEARPVVVGGQVFNIDMCFGVSFYAGDDTSSDSLLQQAGMALNQALHAAMPLRVHFYEQAMDERLKKRMQRLADLRQAIKEEAFELHYQPQVELAGGRLLGFEALVRWRHPRDGWIPPLEFIGLAEQSGLMIPLGQWILRRAVSQLLAWRQADQACASLVVAVNVSPLQFASGSFRQELQQLLEDSGLPAECLELEITESQLMDLHKEPHALLRQLKQVGVLLSIDDFGTGYSSLSYLKHFAVDKLKIDKSFVDHLVTDQGDAAIVEATIAMAHKLGLTVIAEGVETRAQADCLQALGCDEIQGYLIARPLPAEAAFGFLCDAASQH